MGLAAGMLFGLVIAILGGLLLRFHRQSAAFWARAGIRTPTNRGVYFYRYKFGPILMVVFGAAIVLLGVLGAFGVGPTPYRR